MPQPVVFRRVAQAEFDASVAWYENKRVGLGLAFRTEVENHLKLIANQPKRFKKARGEIRQVVLKAFRTQSISYLKSTG